MMKRSCVPSGARCKQYGCFSSSLEVLYTSPRRAGTAKSSWLVLAVSSRHVTERSDELPTLGDSRTVLLEMPVAVIPPAIQETIFALRSRGLVPLIAHPERNELLQDRPSLVAEWIEAGALLQLDGDSLLGIWGHHTERCAKQMLRLGAFHAMASDAHSVAKRPPRLAEALACAIDLVGEDARKLVTTGPELMLAGKPVPARLYDVVATQAVEEPRRRRAGLFGRLLSRVGN